MSNSRYRDAGVNIDEQDKAISAIKKLAASTFTLNVITGLGSFGAMYQLPAGYKNPILVSSSDGVGTKLKVAFMTGIHDTVGQCLVNHCVNDILVQGARPLYFLDYIGTGKLAAGTVEAVVSGLAKGCRENGFSLIGGEMAEMPGFYAEGEYDIAGFITGIVDKSRLLTGKDIVPGDEVWGFVSSGLHTNGYSLARKIVFDEMKLTVESYVDVLGCTVGEEFLKIHRSYRPILLPVLEKNIVKGLAHITGGGFLDNIPRILPDAVSVEIQMKNVPVLPVFDFLVKGGKIETEEAYRVFNMGMGMIAIVSPKNRDAFLGAVAERPVLLGQVVPGDGTVRLL
ncbi:MAG: phosphoribosylformylglycinamidine cyclo-ligase [Acidobacteria bacterium]|nr:phosphoribosylformylglycinamidine cyclo-ligase [Acidobacteriota bacterium]